MAPKKPEAIAATSTVAKPNYTFFLKCLLAATEVGSAALVIASIAIASATMLYAGIALGIAGLVAYYGLFRSSNACGKKPGVQNDAKNELLLDEQAASIGSKA